MTTVTLYHHTHPDAARAIHTTGRFVSALRGQNGVPAAYFSTVRDGHAGGRGDAVVIHAVPGHLLDAWLDDEFPDGELHYEIPINQIDPTWITGTHP